MTSNVDRLFTNRLGLHQFAHLRATTQGMPIAASAHRYLGIAHGAQAQSAHRRVVAQIQILARRRGDPRWRLLGLPLPVQAPGSPDAPPSLDDWAEAQDLDGWSQAEQLALYQEHFPVDAQTLRKQVRQARLIQKRLQLLRDLERAEVTPALPSDRLDTWFSASVASSFLQMGWLTLADVRERIRRGGCWWRGLPAVGPVKAQRLAQHVDDLMGSDAHAVVFTALRVDAALRAQIEIGANRAPQTHQAIDAEHDTQAVQSWISARAGSQATARSYAREMDRFRLWAALERQRGLSALTAEDCRAYMDFIQDLPSSWISRRKVARGTLGWAPFKGALTLASQHQALTILHAAFDWLVKAGYLLRNPWHLVNRKLGDDPMHSGVDPTSRAFSPELWAMLQNQAKADAQRATWHAQAASQRLQWLLTFAEATGLRASELLSLTRDHFSQDSEGWSLRVHGKGRRNRIVPIPTLALIATQTYFAARGLALAEAPPETPLLASLTEPSASISYPALHQLIKSLMKRAQKGMDANQAQTLERASTHWLRHTHATRAAERGVPPDVLQENLGQSDPRTTAGYYRAQMKRRRAAMEGAFGEASAQR